MDPAQYARVSKHYERWLATPTVEREALLDRILLTSPEDHHELELLIAADSARPEFLETGFISDQVLHSQAYRPTRELEAIGPYILGERIGSGGMGVVYRAEQKQPRREVAVKLLRPDFMRPDLQSRFDREAEILGRLQHPGIAQILEAGTVEVDGEAVAFIAMELVRGVCLDQYVAESAGSSSRGALPLQQRLELVIQIAEAIHHAHVRGVIHRDLKPGNIMVDKQDRAKILDFGIARVVSTEPAANLQTREGEWMGTAPYMSPEQIEGRIRDLDTRSDVYSLAVITFELLAGQLPFPAEGVSFAEIATLKTQGQAPALSTLDDRLRGDLETIVAKGLEIDKEARYPSAAEFAMDLRRHLLNEPIQAKPPSTLYRLRKFARRHRGWVAGFALAIGCLVVGTAISIFFAMSASNEARRADRRFQQVHRVSRDFLFEFEEAIRELPGATRARELLVSQALELLSSLSEDALADVELASDLAWAYYRIGKVQELHLQSDSQLLERAEKSYEISEASYRRIVEEANGNTIENRYRWACVKSALASCRRDQGRQEEVEDLEKSARVLLRSVVAVEPNPEYRSALAESLSREGLSLLEQGQPTEAHRLLQESRSILAEIYRTKGDAANAANVAVSLDRLGNLEAARSRPDQALNYYRQAALLRQQIVEEHPENSVFLSARSVSHNKIGDHLRTVGQPGPALSEYRSGLEIRQRMVAADPFNLALKKQLAVSWERTGRAQVSLSQFEEAKTSWEQSLALCKEVARADPANVDLQRNLAIAHTSLGDLESRAGNPDASRGHFERGLEIREQLIELQPRSIRAVRDLAIARNRLGQQFRSIGNHDAALVEFEHAFVLAQRAANLEPERFEAKIEALLFGDRVGESLMLAGRLSEAEVAIQDNLDRKSELLSEAPGHRRTERSRLTSLYLLSELYSKRAVAEPELRLAQLKLAITALEECLEGFDQRRKERPLSPREEAQIAPLRKKLETLRSQISTAPSQSD